jgi:hypothetical protein
MDALAKLQAAMPARAAMLMDDCREDPYGIPIVRLMAMLHTFQKCKDDEYGRSWARRGMAGVLGNALRKTDRLENLGMVTILQEGSRHARLHMWVALVDTLVDIACYALMWASYVARHKPAAFGTWLEDVWCKTTGVGINDAMAYWKGDD